MGRPGKRIAVVGDQDVRLTEALRDAGCVVETVPGHSTFALVRALRRLRPAVVHARAHHLRTSLVSRVLNLPLLLQVGRDDVSPRTAYAARSAARTLCGGALVRESLLALGAPAASTSILRSLLDVTADLRAAAIFPPMLDPAIRWVVAASPCDGPDRGHQDLLLAFLSVARTRPRLKLLIAGEGPDAGKLRAQAEQAGMAGRVVVHGVALEQLPAVFARAACVVGPSRSGSLPDPVPEALAVGAPVVATATGLHASWIREGRTGWLVPSRAPVALAGRLAHVADEPELAQKIGQNALEAAQELAAPGAIAQELLRCYAALAPALALKSAGLYLPARGRKLQGA